MALDAKMNFDDSALKRHPDIAALRDREEGDPLERAAAEKGLTYVRLGGSIGTLVNGAGLAMATMDAINRLGPSLPTSLTPGAGPARKPSPPGFNHAFRSACPGHPHQYFWGHPALRHRGARHRERGP